MAKLMTTTDNNSFHPNLYYSDWPSNNQSMSDPSKSEAANSFSSSHFFVFLAMAIG
jgi:hypothetical protein